MREKNTEQQLQAPTVCVITGGLINVNEKSVWKALYKQFKQYRQSKHHWLETKIKLVSAEPVLLSRIQRKNKTAKAYFSSPVEDMPDLTEVVLVDELSKQGISSTTLKCDDIFQMSISTEETLEEADTIFISSTLLHDLSELHTILKPLERFNKRIVIGGALAGSLYKEWDGDSRVDILAIGYGEYLIPIIAEWIKSGFELLKPGKGRAISSKNHTIFLFSTVPKDKSLDFIARPRWNHLKREKVFAKIAYESVRGCPYRCSFCNYPYLFNDKVFRKKSAQKIADDWEAYAKEGVKQIVCLDSLFTLPKSRVEELCHLLLQRGIHIEWTCYARADDLEDKEFVQLMYDAGARQFQIGVESGSQEVLDAMNKRCTVASNLLAIKNCKEVGITTVVSIIVGFPKETEQTLQMSLAFLEQAKPDFHFLATFSVRVEDVPILRDCNRKKYGLEKVNNPYSLAPYWQHATMSCAEVGNHVRHMNEYLARNKISLDGSLFYSHIDSYRPEMKKGLLDFQYKSYRNYKFIRYGFNVMNQYVDRKLKADLQRFF